MIPYGKQDISDADIEAVVEVLRSDFLTQGPLVGKFEEAVASYVGCSRVVAVNSATSALHLGCLALGVSEGDVVWTSAISFVASANAARYCGAEVDFVDIEPESFNMSTVALKKKLVETSKKGLKLPKVVIPVAMAGQSADMKEIFELSREYGFKVLEDASHALGADYLGNKVGSCQFSDVTVFSFHPVKMITTGEGGACATNDSSIAKKIQRLRSHGITRNVAEMESPRALPYYYEQLELGFNYRITDFQCALGVSQLRRVDEFVRSRQAIAQQYGDKIQRDWATLPSVNQDRNSTFHLFILRIEETAPISRDQVFEAMRANGILVNLHYMPIYRHPYYSQMKKYNPADFPSAEDYFSRAISLPIYHSLSEEEVDRTVSALEGSLGHQTIF